MPEPKWVISMGAVRDLRGILQQLRHRPGRQSVIPWIFMCRMPARPEALLYAILQLQEKISNERRQFKRALNIA